LSRAVIDEALDLIDGDRARQYGSASKNMAHIAERWNQLLGLDQQLTIRPIQPWQVCAMLMDLKMARLCQSYKHDTAVDLIGYACLMADMIGDEDDGTERP
jgi:hypothetical protein